MHSFFELILAPYTVADFFNTYHEKDILLIQRNDEAYYKSILSVKEISEYLERMDVFYPSLRIVKSGKEIPHGEYTLKSTPIGHHRKDGIINTDKAFALFNSGATFVIQAGQRYFDTLSRCCLQLSTKFNAPVQANLYITPNKSQGFQPHWDTHDVFVLQISGTKTWHLYGLEKELPTRNQAFVSKGYDKKPVKTIQLAPGDFLYVPRGYVHDAVADDGISAHVTIGILSFTWARYFNEVFSQLENQKEFREAIPFWREDLKDVLEEKISFLKNSIRTLDFEKGLEKLDQSYKNTQPQPFRNYFESIRKSNNITPTTPLAVNENLIYDYTQNGNAQKVIKLPGKEIQLPETAEDLIAYVLTNKKFTLENLPGSMDNKEKKEMLVQLVKEGLVYIDEP